MMFRAALCYALQPTFGQLQLLESLTKNILVQKMSSLVQSRIEVPLSYKSSPRESHPSCAISFSPWPIYLQRAFLSLDLKTFCLKIYFSPGFCKVARSFLSSLNVDFVRVWSSPLSASHPFYISLWCVRVVGVCTVHVHKHTGMSI